MAVQQPVNGLVNGSLLMVTQLQVILVVYLFVGGGVLSLLEAPHEHDAIVQEQDRWQRANLTAEQRVLLEGICKFRTADGVHEWTFAGATFFSLTVVTTIGYGHVTPLTDVGRVFTFAYSLIGISLVAHVLQKSALEVLVMLTRCWRRCTGDPEEVHDEKGGVSKGIREKADVTFAEFDQDGSGTIDIEELGQFLEALSGDTVDPLVVQYVMHEADSDPDEVLTREEMIQAVQVYYAIQTELPESVPTNKILSAMAAMACWLGVWGLVFATLEGWRYRDGFWYTYVTLTTIGFGDYHPQTQVGRILGFFFVLPGLGIVGYVINSIFARLRWKRYWLLQHAYANGKISEKVLLGQGIRPLFKGKMFKPPPAEIENGGGTPDLDETDTLYTELNGTTSLCPMGTKSFSVGNPGVALRTQSLESPIGASAGRSRAPSHYGNLESMAVNLDDSLQRPSRRGLNASMHVAPVRASGSSSPVGVRVRQGPPLGAGRGGGGDPHPLQLSRARASEVAGSPAASGRSESPPRAFSAVWRAGSSNFSLAGSGRTNGAGNNGSPAGSPVKPRRSPRLTFTAAAAAGTDGHISPATLAHNARRNTMTVTPAADAPPSRSASIGPSNHSRPGRLRGSPSISMIPM